MQQTTALALFLRIIIAVCTCTFFQPDEYFQSLEPAHHLVFGYGHLTWEWVNSVPIRSILYPALNVPLYWALKACRLDDSVLLILGPKILHGALAALVDVWIRDLARKVLGERYVSTAYFLSMTSFFNALSLSRSLSNSLETAFTIVAFTFYPWDGVVLLRRDLRTMLTSAALGCAVRPTNAIIWLYLMVVLLWRVRRDRPVLSQIVSTTALVGSIAVLLITVLDSAYYGKPTFTPLNFLRINMSSVSIFYGANSLTYYVVQALPILCTVTLPFTLHGAWTNIGASDAESLPLRTCIGCVVWTLAIYSAAGHKEWRFIHPLLPLLQLLAAKSLVDLVGTDSQAGAVSDSKARSSRLCSLVPPLRLSVITFLLLTVPTSVYVIRFHGAAQISVMHYLRAIPPAELRSVGFVAPCHSTPGQAYLHRPDAEIWALGCEPPLGLDSKQFASYKDQTDIFFEAPAQYLTERFPNRVDLSFPRSPKAASAPGEISKDWVHTWPQYLILFGALLTEPGVQDILRAHGYREVWKAGRDWEGDSKRKGGVRVWRVT